MSASPRHLRWALACVLALAVAASARGARSWHYATTRALEPDRCVTAWVLKRYCHPDAAFTFHDDRHLPKDAIPFDLPDARLRRDGARAAIEVLIAEEHLRDPFVLQLGRLVHDIEINYWATRHEPGSREFELALRSAIMRARTPEAGLAATFAMLDSLRGHGGDLSVLHR